MSEGEGEQMSLDGRMTARVTGRVQRVGFRMFVRRELARLGLDGTAVNLPDGSVEVVAEGAEAACEELADVLRSGTRTPGRVEDVSVVWDDLR